MPDFAVQFYRNLIFGITIFTFIALYSGKGTMKIFRDLGEIQNFLWDRELPIMIDISNVHFIHQDKCELRNMKTKTNTVP